MALGGGQPLADQIDVLRRRRDALLRFLLECVKDVDRAGELHGVDRAVRVRVVPVDDLHHLGASEALQRFGRGIGSALLRGVERLAHISANLLREAA